MTTAWEKRIRGPADIRIREGIPTRSTSRNHEKNLLLSGSSTLLVGENVVFVQRGRIRAANLECGSLLPLSDWGRFTGNKAAASRRTPKSHGLHRGETPAGRAASDP